MSSVANIIHEVLAIDPAAPAIEFNRTWIRWGELSALIHRIDALLLQAGLGVGTRVGILLRNRPPQLAASLMSIASNRCLVTLNPLLPDEKLLSDITSLRLPVVIGERSDLDRTGVMQALANSGTAAIVLDPTTGVPPAFPVGYERPRGFALHVEQSGVIIEMLSSGTTGAPRRIPLHVENFERGFAAGNAYEKGRDSGAAPKLRSGVVFLTLPFTHISGLWAVIQTIAAGRKSFLMEKFDLEQWRDGIVRHRPKLLTGPPTMLRMILDANLPKADLSSVIAIRTGTAPLDPAIVDEFLLRYSIPVLENYGATEFAGAVSGWTLDDFHKFRVLKRGSVGRLQPGVQSRIVDLNTFEPLAAGAEGLLELKGSQLGAPDRWLRTTDRAMLDADGFLFIKGRADNAILRGGFKIHPDEVARAIEAHPAVREASVVGVKDTRLGEVPVAALVARTGFDPPSAEELSRFLRATLAAYQIPVHFKFVKDLPRTPSMKVSQSDVRALFGA
jgi:long-chain acyl-CoA synthetase